MERHFGLPIAFAAALHGALLFGFTKTPRATAVMQEPRTVFPVTPVAPPEDPVEIVPADTVRESKPAPAAPEQTRSPEPPPVITEGEITIPKPPAPVFDRDTSIIEVPAVAGPGGPGYGPGDIVPPGYLDNPPRTRFQAAPLYPMEAKSQGLRGEVLVEFIVDERGRVLEPRVISASHRVFEEPTLRAVAKWVFEPGKRDGRVVRFRMAVPVIFNLND